MRAVLFALLIAALAVLACAEDAVFVNVECVDPEVSRAAGTFWRYTPWDNWTNRTETFYGAKDTDSMLIKAVEAYTSPTLFYFGGTFMFFKSGGLWRNLAVFDSLNEKFVGSRPQILPDNSVSAMKLIGGELYVAGQFQNLNPGADALACNFVYKISTDGTTPSCLPGLNVDGGSSGILSIGGTAQNDIYVGGDFQIAGKAANFAVWNGQTWTAISIPGVAGPITSIREDGSRNIYFAYNLANNGNLWFGARQQDSSLVWTQVATFAASQARVDPNVINALHMANRGEASETIYVGGAFDKVTVYGAQTSDAQGVAYATTASIKDKAAQFKQLGNGLVGTVLSLHQSHGSKKIYAAGNGLSLDNAKTHVAVLYTEPTGTTWNTITPPVPNGGYTTRGCISHSVVVGDRSAPSNPSDSKVGLILGLVFGLGGGLLLIGGVAFYFLYWRKRSRYTSINK